MAQPSISWGYSNPEETKSIAIPDFDWTADFSAKTKTADTTVVKKKGTPLDQEETIRFQSQSIKNIYNNSGIDPAYFSVSKAGVQAHVQVRDIARVSDADDNTFRVDLPVSVGITVRCPVSSYLSADDVLHVVLRAYSSLFGTGSTSSDRLADLLGGSTTPGTL